MLKYRVEDGMEACCCYDATSPDEMGRMVLDAIDLAAKSLKERD